MPLPRVLLVLEALEKLRASDRSLYMSDLQLAVSTLMSEDAGEEFTKVQERLKKVAKDGFSGHSE